MGNKKEVTIYDLARELNISASTVSRALKGHHSIGKKTINEVKDLAEKLGYRPNGLAVSLRSNKTQVIGVVISWVNRPFVSSLISGVEEVASKAGYRVIIAQSHDSYKNEVESVQALFDSRVSGLVVSLAMETQEYEHFEKFLRQDIPVVFVDRVAEEVNFHRVIIDNFQAGFTATEHLIEQGCKRIAHFAGAQHRNIYKERMRGYLEALSKYNLPVDESLIMHCNNLSMEEGKKVSNQLL
ncbi:MAG: LacI family DNA-binding transcriptional regulator, partial [Saprospiraceae bacterium]|nr:LacI family DNA-binding transcriptional regulator [Saprospiraceae bacterium]